MGANLYLVRGLPGSGKSTFARALSVNCYSADDFFTRDGVYDFDPRLIGNAHLECQDKTKHSLSYGDDVAVAMGDGAIFQDCKEGAGSEFVCRVAV